MFKLPVDVDESSISKLSTNSERADLIRQCDLIIWDEISTVSKRLLEIFNNLLQDICRSSKIFGGKAIIFAGDFRQIQTVCIVIRNLSFDHGLVNGTKLIIKKISKFILEAIVPGRTDTVFIPRIMFKFTVGSLGLEMIRRQFPIKLAYALTINKSQGQTLDCVGIDLRSDVFSHGQLYVALGRIRNSENLRILLPSERIISGIPFTKNIVIKDLIK
ncbi:hypothetical protein O3M35_012258 [Rhynocoris fuscipes]|uniref:ATP-dependent DNA helicase n=1 Tax=Rhynocoris fuscipes TaxID=488301 RepID=A0AAW1CRR6_9HEMI